MCVEIYFLGEFPIYFVKANSTFKSQLLVEKCSFENCSTFRFSAMETRTYSSRDRGPYFQSVSSHDLQMCKSQQMSSEGSGWRGSKLITEKE